VYLVGEQEVRETIQKNILLGINHILSVMGNKYLKPDTNTIEKCIATMRVYKKIFTVYKIDEEDL
jgi:hypothetical protein